MDLTISQSQQNSNLTHITQSQSVNISHTIDKQSNTEENIAKYKQQQYIKQPIRNHMDHISQTASLTQIHNNPQHSDPNRNKTYFNTQSQSSQSMLLDSQRTSIADETPVHYSEPTNALNTVQTLKQIAHSQSQYKTVTKKLFNQESQLQASLSLTQIASSCPQNRQSLKYSSSNNQSPGEDAQNCAIRKQKKQQMCWTCAENEYNAQSPLIRNTSSNKQQKQSPYLSYNKISPFDLLPMPKESNEQNLLEELQQDYTPYPTQQYLVNQYNYQPNHTASVPKLSAFHYSYGSSDIIYEEYLENQQDEQQSTKQILYPQPDANGLMSQLGQHPLPTSKLASDRQSRILPSLHVDNHKWSNQNHPDNDHTLLGGQAIRDLFKQFYTNAHINNFKTHRSSRLLQKKQNIQNMHKSPFKKVKSIQKIVYQAQEKIIKQKPITNPQNVSPARRVSYHQQRAIILQINIIQEPIQMNPLKEDMEQKKSLYLKNIRPEEIRHVNDPDTDSRYAHEQPLVDLITSIKVCDQKIQLNKSLEKQKTEIDGDVQIVSNSKQQGKDISEQTQSTPIEYKQKAMRTQQKVQQIQKKAKIIKISTEQKKQSEIGTDRPLQIGECDLGVREIKIINNSQSQKMMNSPNRVRDRIKVFIRTKHSKTNTNVVDYNSQSAQTIQLTSSLNYDKNYCLHPNMPSNMHLNNIQSLYNVHTEYSHEDAEQNQSRQHYNKQVLSREYIKIANNNKDISYINPPKNTPNYSPILNKQDEVNIKQNKNPKVTIVQNSSTLSPRKHKIDLVSQSNFASSGQYYDFKQQANTKCSMLTNRNKISTPFLFCASPQTEPQHNQNPKKKLLNLNGKSEKAHKIVSSKTDEGKLNYSPHKKWIELSAPRREQEKEQIKYIQKLEMIESDMDITNQQRNRREEIQNNIKYLSNFSKLNNAGVNINRKNKYMAANQLNHNIGQPPNPKYRPTYS